MQNHSKELRLIRKNLAKYIEKMDVYYAAVNVQDHKISNRKETGGKLGAAKRFYNQALKYKNQINLSDSLWSATLAELQHEHRNKKA